MQLSIIIPVYNVADYVEKCIRSCAEQNILLSNYEIIVVNDGSKDDSLSVVEKVASDYRNIRIISQKNGGLSAARNTGLMHACGDYVWFVDGDDWIEPNCLKYIIRKLIIENLDVYEFNTYMAKSVNINYDITKESYYSTIYTSSIISGIDYLSLYGYRICVCNKIIRRSLLISNKLFFPLGQLSEDNIYTFDLYICAKRVFKDRKFFYYYFQRSNSITNTRNTDHLMKYHADQLSIIFTMNQRIKCLHDNPSFNSVVIKEMISFLSINLLYSSFVNKLDFISILKSLKSNNLIPFNSYNYHNQSKIRELFRIFVNLISVFVK